MKRLELASRKFGGKADAPVVVMLHGLLGSSRNWQTAGGLLADAFSVHALDLRNHGDSPHNAVMDYPEMAADVKGWLKENILGPVHLVGHSMGGKVAMYLACHFGDAITSLTVVDIAPRAYPPRWEREFAIMRRMPVETFARRSEAEDWLAGEISDWAFRKFLVSNLDRRPEGGFSWRVNLRVLEAALPNLFQQIPKKGESYGGKVLFLKGERSRFIEESDLPMIRRFFPHSELQTIPDSGHNVHFDQPEKFACVLRDHISPSQ